MFKKLALYISIVICAAGVISCNSDSDDTQIVSSPSSVIISAFSLAENDKVLANLDSVYFSIDLVNARIFNADSLPYGTKVNRLIVNITTDGCSETILRFPNNDGTGETVVNYLTNSTDSIDFSKGEVTVHLVSSDKSSQRDYKIAVNVHKMKPDSLYWNRIARRNIPSSFSSPKEQKTILHNEKIICLTSDNTGKYSIATSANPGNNDWETQLVTFPFTPNINTLTNTNDALYILDTNGMLYKSTDFLTWTSCNITLNHIYGGYEDMILGNQKDGYAYYFVTYPETTSKSIGIDFPISGTSQLIEINNKWSSSPQVIMIGGKCIGGKLSGDTWGFDGKEWAKISASPISDREGMTLFAYPTFITNTDNWTVSKYPSWIALGGFNQDGRAVKDVYLSIDNGIHWKRADDLMQLPNYIPAMANSQAFVFESTIEARTTNVWDEYASKPLPSWWQIASTPYQTRISELDSQWDCPYIYLFGGTTPEGNLYNSVWKGVINRLTFRPLQ